MYSEVHVGKHLFDNFPIQNSLKQSDALSPHFQLWFRTLIMPIRIPRKPGETETELAGGGHQLLAYADVVNLLGGYVDTINMSRNTETLIDASKEAGLEVNIEKTIFCYLRSKLGHKNSKHVILKCATVQIFGNDSNKSKYDSQGS
jgi:hypothetical protein